MNGTQCKMARAAFGLSTHDLAKLAGVGRITVVRLEAGDRIAPDKLDLIKAALADKGAEFSRRLSGRVGVTVPE